jgi:HTH-type transcriptional regulator/antitoxin HigA
MHTHQENLIQALNMAFPLAREITTPEEHEQALAQIEDLLEDYATNQIVIEALSKAIEQYESTASELEAFNRRQKHVDPAVAMLRLLMEQHDLNTTDFEEEIGKKSLVSQILNGHKQLTRRHIEKLAKRFRIAPAQFF